MRPERPNLSESAWARGWLDTKRALAQWWFWFAEVLGGAPIAMFGGENGPLLALVYVLGVAFALWLGATASAPIKQRNEARFFIALKENSGLKIVFSDTSSFHNRVSFTRSNGEMIELDYHFISIHNDTDLRVRNVGLKIMRIPGSHLFEELELPAARGRPFIDGADRLPLRVDLAPGETRLFQFVFQWVSPNAGIKFGTGLHGLHATTPFLVKLTIISDVLTDDAELVVDPEPGGLARVKARRCYQPYDVI